MVKVLYIRKFLGLAFLLTVLFFSQCQNKSATSENVKRFDQDLFAPTTEQESLSYLKSNYPEFLTLFCEHVIRIGPVTNPNTASLLQQFKQDPVIQEVYTKTQSSFNSTETISAALTSGLSAYQKSINQEDVPNLIYFISGFNQSFITLPNILAVGLDNYLGDTCTFYSQLGLPEYAIKTMNANFLVSDAIRAWIQSDMEEIPMGNKLIDQMIRKGKIIFAAQMALGKKSENRVLRYTEEQGSYCKKNEVAIWEYLIEQELLFSSDALLIRRLTGEAPFSRDFGIDSPPRIGEWVGYRIVKSYMKNNSVGMEQLLFSTTAQEILSKSNYHPK